MSVNVRLRNCSSIRVSSSKPSTGFDWNFKADMAQLDGAAAETLYFNFLEDAAGEKFSRGVAVFCDAVGSSPHPATWPNSSGHQLQDQGQDPSGELDSPCFTGNKY